jgi:hypothetical protein
VPQLHTRWTYGGGESAELDEVDLQVDEDEERREEALVEAERGHFVARESGGT